MRKFSSYGPIDSELHYYAPRTGLLDKAYVQLVGENPEKGGHYITVWAPRQTGKTWLLQQTLFRLREDPRFHVVAFPLEVLKQEESVITIVEYIGNRILEMLGKPSQPMQSLKAFQAVFTPDILDKPLILMLDEFDALCEEAISSLAGLFRHIYLERQNDPRPSARKAYLLHGIALIGVRSVLGIENVRGSPFNVQRSLHIPNLTFDEAAGMFRWYERESGQTIEPEVIQRLYQETDGQPGLTCWLGEILTEGHELYQPPKETEITMTRFEQVYMLALDVLPNNNILNIISKVKQAPYKNFVLELFKTDGKLLFKYDNPLMNYLYMNGVIALEQPEQGGRVYVKFASPFVQKRLFNYFSDDLFHYVGKVFEPFEDLTDTITDNHLNVSSLLRRYERYLQANKSWLLQNAPRRADLRIYEAVYHFNLYMYLHRFLQGFRGQIHPEFPTGNGKIDLIIQYAGQTYGLEVKSYSTRKEYREALIQTAQYGRQLGLTDITLVIFVEAIDEAHRQQYEKPCHDAPTGVTVTPVFLETGN